MPSTTTRTCPGTQPKATLLTTALGESGYRTVSIQTNKYVQRLDKKFDEAYHFLIRRSMTTPQ
ncbi:MAG: hypothetical protein U0411_03445 [Thermodesulfovibrionales bacterium]